MSFAVEDYFTLGTCVYITKFYTRINSAILVNTRCYWIVREYEDSFALENDSNRQLR
jgi:hypothetical protein